MNADDGIDVRLRGIKIKSSRQRELGLNADMFQPANLVRYPRLEGTDPDVLYRRAVVIQRYGALAIDAKQAESSLEGIWAQDSPYITAIYSS